MPDPSNEPVPDPLRGLSAFERRRILTMRPTWSERHRMCIPGRTREQRRDVLIDILFERRRAFDREMFLRTKRAELERAHNRYHSGEHHLTDHNAEASTALSRVSQQRREQDLREQNVREAYFRKRAERDSAGPSRTVATAQAFEPVTKTRKKQRGRSR